MRILPDTFALTPNQAALIRKWRIDEDETWRSIAHEADHHGIVNDPLRGNQLVGMDLCEIAARHYGEHFMDYPWNA